MPDFYFNPVFIKKGKSGYTNVGVVVLADLAFSRGWGGLYYVATCVKPHAFGSILRILMLFLMTFIAKQFKVTPIKRDAWVVNIRWCYVFLVVNDVPCTAAAFADSML